MVKIGITICPLMTRDSENPIFCRRDCATFCIYLDHNGNEQIRPESDGYCGMMPA